MSEQVKLIMKKNETDLREKMKVTIYYSMSIISDNLQIHALIITY